MEAKYLIIGKRWFQRTYGNTYHSFSIRDLNSGELLVDNDTWQYGYGQMWMQNAYNKLVEMGLAKPEDRNNHALNKLRFVTECIDVPRRRDLTR